MLVDTSVWIDHLRRGNGTLAACLENAEVSCHPFIVGELACGNLARRDEVLGLLCTLPQVPEASHSEVMVLVGSQRLFGRGIGWIDMHLLASAMLANTELWTLDKRLGAVAQELGVCADVTGR